MNPSTVDYVILGGGVAGLTMAREIARTGRSVMVVEKEGTVGGLSRTFRRDGFSFDLGGHRFHSNNPEVVAWLRELMREDLLRVRRLSRIHLQGRFVDYPIRLGQAVSAFGYAEAVRIAGSYAHALMVNHSGEARSFEDWVTRRFGRALYDIYFKPYTEKVWGIPCHELSADWASQRISLPSFTQAVYRALVPTKNPPPTIIPYFYYPRLGYGTITDRMAEQVVEMGGAVMTSTALDRLRFDTDEAVVDIRGAADAVRTIRCQHVVSTIPVDLLLDALSHEPDVARAAAEMHLVYRGVLLIFLALDRPRVSPDSWTYFPNPALLFGRSHEPKNWSAAMVPGEQVTSLALEVFSSPGESAWKTDDGDLVDRAVNELEEIGWVRRREVLGAWVLRVPHAYPVYYLDYRDEVRKVRTVLGRWPRLSLVGRTGSFRYMNVDGIVEDCLRLVGELSLTRQSTVQPLAVDVGRWV
jgi:protoporphyrinogen oxidase